MNQSGTNIYEEYEIKPLIPIQGANKAGIMPDGSLAGTRPEHLPKLTLFERLFGRSASPTDQVGGENITVSQTPRVGGIFPDISAGYRENRTTPISVNNFGQNKLEDGRNKGFAYKLGEGLGSLARFAESPAGRGLLVAGLVGATGGGALPALAFGGSTSLMNQQNRAKDRLYRNALEQQGVDTSNIKGYVTDDPFKNYTLANYRNRNLDQTSYIKMTKQLEQLHKTGQISNDAYMAALSDLNTQYVNSNTFNINKVKDSNETILTPVKASAIASNAAANTKRANAYSDWMTNKTHNNEAENADLAEFLEILNANNNDKTEYARNAFIKKYGKDPYKLIKM